MTVVYCFSGTGHSRAVARYMAEKLGTPVREIGKDIPIPSDVAVIVFPVYCQNIPAPVKAVLPQITAKHVALIATYGKMGCGNVLWESAKLVKGQVIAGAYVPTGHTYLEEGTEFDTDPLQTLLERIRDPKPVLLPRRKKWWLADVLPDGRSRLSVKLERTRDCTQCGLCTRDCPMGTMENGRPGKNCIRCLRCVKICPAQAIRVSYGRVLRAYLRKPKQNEWIFYV